MEIDLLYTLDTNLLDEIGELIAKRYLWRIRGLHPKNFPLSKESISQRSDDLSFISKDKNRDIENAKA